MSLKSFIQTLILVLIILIVGGVYYKYFDTNKEIIEEINTSEINNQQQLEELEKKISELELINDELNEKIEINKKKSETEIIKKQQKETKKEIIVAKEELNLKKKNILENNEKNVVKNEQIKNLVKNIEYITIDQKGNKFYLLANSGKSNKYNNDILDLVEVKGEITSDSRDTIYIVSDFAQYNSVNLNSKFYENVIINYQDKEITCVNFDINMEKNKAIAYNDVLITDPNSTMKAGIVEFDLKTKNININPESSNKQITVTSN